MRKALQILIGILLGVPLLAQTTTVSGTVKDTSNQGWINATLTFNLYNPSHEQIPVYCKTGSPVTVTQTAFAGTDANASYTISLPQNSTICPKVTRWQLTVCPVATSGCFTDAPINVAGATQTYNVTPSVPQFSGRSTYGYNTNEILNPQIGDLFWNVYQNYPTGTCYQYNGGTLISPTWQTCPVGNSNAFLNAQSLNFSNSAFIQFPVLDSDAGAAINTAFTTNNVVIVSTAASPVATSVITIPNATTGLNGIPGMLEIRGSGTFTTNQILAQDSTTANVQAGTLWCPEGATIKLANNANHDLISDTNFSSLTGTTNQYGALGFAVIGCVLDGNKSNNTSGWTIRIYGRKIALFTGEIDNGKSGGAWLEAHDPLSFTGPADADEQTAANIKVIGNGGDAIYVPQGQGWDFNNITTANNSGWGLKTAAPVSARNFNSYLNSSGGCDIQSGGSISGSVIACTSAAGWGLLVETGAGSSAISSSTFACNGCIGLEIRSTHQVIAGILANSSIGMNFNGGGGVFNFAAFANTTDFKCTSFIGNSIVDVYNNDSADTMFDASTCGSSTVPPGIGWWKISSATTAGNVVSFPTSQIYAGGYLHTLPSLNGTLAVMQNGAQTLPFYAGNFITSGVYTGSTTVPTITGCGTISNQVGNGESGTFKTSATSCTPVLTALPSSNNGYACLLWDETTPNTPIGNKSSTSTSATFGTFTTVASDTIAFNCGISF